MVTEVVLVLVMVGKVGISVVLSLLCYLFCAILEVMYGNGGGFGFGYGGEGGKGSNPSTR